MTATLPSIRLSTRQTGASPFLVFQHRQSRFALELSSIREVLPCGEHPITPVPNTLPFLLGLTNLRGQLLPVGDFCQLLEGSPVDRQHAESRILVLEMFDLHHSSRIHFGLAVPQVAGVLPLDHNRIASAAEVSPELVPYLRGLYDWEGTLLMVLETDAIGACDRW